MSSFGDRLTTLAYQADIKVAEVDPAHAEVNFTFSGNEKETHQRVWITPFNEGQYWEFSCLAAIKENDPGDFPKALLVYALRENARKPLGFWCIKKFSNGNNVLDYMQNMRSALLTPDAFRDTCRTVAREVDKFEREYMYT
ncbi:hypothetical protein [Streptomyces cinnamoneus]|uniref:YbjN domain-containing protein n=1 Tax=Streptomyces cinnamoneus TaxID=53446 RepID=A0A918WRB7_STRCJ|nr:hypothetical protein [Streptomyces cinnamoneus]GHC67055.1 hypothetical protein GCM10010507_51290 [Streptomyces cinnamoneus]